MKKVITIESCDICGKESKIKKISFPVFRTYDATDGRTSFKEPQIYEDNADLCIECLKKITNVFDSGVQCRKLEIRKLDN